jgi:hypothetical protein
MVQAVQRVLSALNIANALSENVLTPLLQCLEHNGRIEMRNACEKP